MKSKLTKSLSLMLAGILQLMPLLRSALPTLQELASSPTGALILRWTAGGVALFGYHAISRASSIAISPPTAFYNVPYSGTITYTGSHSGSVSSVTMSNTCLGTHVLAPGLNVTYTGGHTCSVSGTPTTNALNSTNTVTFTLKMWDLGGCTGSLTDTRSTSITIGPTNGGLTSPNITLAPQPVIAQTGSDVALSGAAVGNPPPTYYWQKNLVTIPGQTNNTLLIPAAQLTNAGIYTFYATNSSGQLGVNCFVTMAITAGSNFQTYEFTNYWPAGVPVTMVSLITNVSTAVNTYSWQYQFVNIGITTPNLSLSGAQTVPSKSGTYTVNFNSTVGTSNVVVNQAYDSYWTFGYVPIITNQPTGLTVTSGSNATFNVTVCGTTPTLYWYQSNSLVATHFLNFNPSSGTATTNDSLTINGATSANAGTYTVVESNAWGMVTSSNAVLTVGSSLSVSSPQGQTNYAGKNISLSVTPSGTAPFGYQWLNGSGNVSNGGNISGATTNTLNFTPAAVTNSGNYSVIVSNTSGSVTSSVAAVSILPLPKFGLLASSSNSTLTASGGVPGSNYVVQVSTNIANTNGWSPIYTNVVPPNGVISFTDTNISAAQRFYRVQFP